MNESSTPWGRIKEHKVIQWTLGYLAAALALTHSEELIARAFDWPELLSRALIIVLALGLPVAITLAWYHGHRASRHVSGAEATIIAILLLIGAGFLSIFVRPREALPTTEARSPAGATQPIAAVAAARSKPRLAILPFANLSPDPANAFFADGLHEEILATLAQRAPGLEVISHTTMMLYRTAPRVEVIARELSATHVLEGSVQRVGPRVKLTLELIDARTDSNVWARDFDGTLTDPLTLQSEVAKAVAAQLAVRFGGNAPSSLTADPEAYDLYLKARLARRNLGESEPDIVAEAVRITALLEQAIRRDPSFAQAHVELANHLLRLYQYVGDERMVTGARDHLAIAQTLIPGDAGLTLTQAMYNYAMDIGQPLTPAVEAALAATQDPLNGQVGSRLYGQAGRFEDTHALFERLIRLDPGNLFLLETYIDNLVDLRRPQEALQALATIASPRVPSFDLFRKMSRACIPYSFTGRDDLSTCSAVSDSANEASFDRSPTPLLRRARYLLVLRRYADARALLEKSGSTESFGESITGPRPLAEDLGWIALLMNDAPAARKQSEAIREYLDRSPRTHVLAWYGKALAAEAQLFAGDHAGAIATTQEVLATRPREKDAWTWYWVAKYSARILAWAGAEDRAVSLLDNLSTVQGGLPPALVTRDPLFDVPLAKNPQWRALKARLEAQMAATKLE